MSTEHITIEVQNGRVQVVVDDYELFDFIDDLMIDNDLEYEFRANEIRSGREHYVMLFRPEQSVQGISEILATIPNHEIRRIWALNNT